MKNRRAMNTKLLLRDGLFRLLQTKKLEKITITELCQESGINRVTFYNHYTDPRGILQELEEDMVREMHQTYSLPLTSETMLSCLENICTYLYENSHYVKVLIQYNTDTELTNFMNDISNRFRSVNDQLLDMPMVDADAAKLITTFVGSGSYFLLAQWIMEGVEKTPAEIASIIYSIIYGKRS